MKKHLIKKIFNFKPAFYFFVVVLIFGNCTYNPPPKEDESKNEKVDMVKVNEYLSKQDRRLIEKYIERSGLEMNETETGLWYVIHEHGEGEEAKKGMVATLDYRSMLLDGTVVYSSDSLGAKTFKLGQGGVETGLEEGILLLNEGDTATFILAPHLAHGLIGDQKKIPPRAALIYHLRLVDLQ